MAKRKRTKRTAKARTKKQAQPVTRTALVEPGRKLEDLPALSEEGAALAYEIGLNRKAILSLGKIALDHERRIAGLEESLAELAGVEDADLVEVEAEPEEEGEEGAAKRLSLPDLIPSGKGKSNGKRKRSRSTQRRR